MREIQVDKIKFVTIKITKETPDLRKNAVVINGKRKIIKPEAKGRFVRGIAEELQPFLDAGVAELVKGDPLKEKFDKAKKDK